MTEFVGLRSKMYSYIRDNDKGSKTAKGIKKVVIKKDITHEDYKNVLFNNKQIYHNMKPIQSVNHQLGSYELNKISLSCFKMIKDISMILAKQGLHMVITKFKNLSLLFTYISICFADKI